MRSYVYSRSQHGEPLSPAASTLAMVLTRGLSMEQQKSSRDSLQYSSGYSTQTNTPSCSEDTIPSQGRETPVLLEHIYSIWTPWGNPLRTPFLHGRHPRSNSVPKKTFVDHQKKLECTKLECLYFSSSFPPNKFFTTSCHFQVLIMSATLSTGMLTMMDRQTLTSPPQSRDTAI